MVDNRFDQYPVDTRFPEPGTDTRFPGGGVDERFPGGGVDGRFMVLSPIGVKDGGTAVTQHSYVHGDLINTHPDYATISLTTNYESIVDDVDVGIVSVVFTEDTITIAGTEAVTQLRYIRLVVTDLAVPANVRTYTIDTSVAKKVLLPREITLTGLTNGLALDGTMISSVVTPLGAETVEYRWQRTETDDLEGLSGITILIDIESDMSDGDVIRSMVFVDGAGPYFSDWADVVVAKPIISIQPTFSPDPPLVGQALLVNVGEASTGDPSFTQFDVDGVDRRSNLVGATIAPEFLNDGDLVEAEVTWTSTWPEATVSNPITTTVTTNTITCTNPPVLTAMFTLDEVTDQAWWTDNSGFNLTFANYPGALVADPNATLSFRVQREQVPDSMDRENYFPETYQAVVGDRLRLIADVLPEGGGPSLASFFSDWIIVEYEREITVSTQNTFEIAFNPNFPSLSVANPIIIDGVSHDPNATKADYDDPASSVNILAPTATENGAVTTIVDLLYGYWSDPTGTNMAIICEVRDDGGALVATITSATYDATALAGTTISLTFIMNSVSIVVPYAVPASSGAYIPNRILNNGTAFSHIPVPTGQRYMTAFLCWSGVGFNAGFYTGVQGFRVSNGPGTTNLTIRTKASNNLLIARGATLGDLMDLTSDTQFLLHVDYGDGVDLGTIKWESWINGVKLNDPGNYNWTDEPGTVESSGAMQASFPIGIMARSTGDNISNCTFYDPLVHFGSLIPPETFWDVDNSLKDYGVVSNYYQQGGPQTAADYNAGTNLVTAGTPAVITVGSATYTDEP